MAPSHRSHCDAATGDRRISRRCQALFADRRGAPVADIAEALLMTKDAVIAICVFVAIMILLAVVSWIGYPNWTTE